MTVRLATEKDIELLDKMLVGMGQFWSEQAIRETLAPPWITILHEDGEVDGFYMGLVMLAEKQTIIGPGDYPPSHDIIDPDERAKAWIKAICEMGLAIEAAAENHKEMIVLDRQNDVDTLEVCVAIAEGRDDIDEIKTIEKMRNSLAQRIESMLGVSAKVAFMEEKSLQAEAKGEKQPIVVDKRKI